MLNSQVTNPASVHITQGTHTYLEPRMVKLLERTFSSEDEYVKIVSNLCKMRDGFYKLSQSNPNPSISDLMISTNELIGCLLPLDVDLLTKITNSARL